MAEPKVSFLTYNMWPLIIIAVMIIIGIVLLHFAWANKIGITLIVFGIFGIFIVFAGDDADRKHFAGRWSGSGFTLESSPVRRPVSIPKPQTRQTGDTKRQQTRQSTDTTTPKQSTDITGPIQQAGAGKSKRGQTKKK